MKKIMMHRRLLLFVILLCSFCGSTFAQQNTISGIVRDVNNEPLPGVNILLKGTMNGRTTNLDGKFTIKVDDDAVLVFSFIGFRTKEVTVEGKSNIEVTLVEDVVGLNEVVAVGYATQKKVNLTGSLSVVSEKELESRPITSISQAFVGTATGVSVSQASGQPGKGNPTVRIRGIGTKGDASPLVLIDGIETSINDINPDDVASMSVLKDASASAIYGSRAANGVILITTKKGKSGSMKVSYSGYTGFQKATRLMEYVSDSPMYMTMQNEFSNYYSDEQIQEWKDNSEDQVHYPSVNWVERTYGNTASINAHNISLRGGGKNNRYHLSIGTLKQDGIVPENEFKRHNMRLNLEADLNRSLTVGVNVMGYWKDIKSNNVDNLCLKIMPSIPYLRDEFGRYGYSQAFGGSNLDNPRAVWDTKGENERKQQFLSKLYLNWKLAKGLKYSANFAMKFNNALNQAHNGYYELYNFTTDEIVKSSSGRSASNDNKESYMLTTYHTLSYKKSIKDHNFSALGGISIEEFRSDNFRGSVDGFPNNDIFVLGVGVENDNVSGSANEWAMLSYFGRLNYDFSGKYLVETNLRYDGSSRFKKGNKWSAFPSFSLGWRMSEESFLADQAWLDNLKLRASWGKLGNQNIGNYPYQATYDLKQNYSFGGNMYSGVANTSLVDSDITWETTTTTNVAIDATIKNRLSFTAEYFVRDTEDILTAMTVPATLGAKKNPIVNYASFRNIGLEFSANYKDKIGDLSYQIGFNITYVDNEVTKFRGEIQDLGNFITQEGLPFNSMYGYVADGLIASAEELEELNNKAKEVTGDTDAEYILGASPGVIKYKDLDGNGIVDSNDRQVIGNVIPKYTYGFNIGAQYKGFDFKALFSGVEGKDGYLGGAGIVPFGVNGDRGQVPQKWVNSYWTAENTTAALPALWNPSKYKKNTYFSTFWMQDASYLRLKNIQVGYSLPKLLLDKLKIEKMRFYVNGENLFTWTDFEGYDPERGMTQTNINYPNLKTVTLGVQLTF